MFITMTVLTVTLGLSACALFLTLANDLTAQQPIVVKVSNKPSEGIPAPTNTQARPAGLRCLEQHL